MLILFFFIALANLHHIKKSINAYVVSLCFSSFRLLKNINLSYKSFSSEDIFTNERSVIKNIQGQKLNKLTYILKFLTRIEFISLTNDVIEKGVNNNTYKNIIYKFIPRYIWKDKPIDDLASKFNKDIDIGTSSNYSIIKLDIFIEGFTI